MEIDLKAYQYATSPQSLYVLQSQDEPENLKPTIKSSGIASSPNNPLKAKPLRYGKYIHTNTPQPPKNVT